MNLRSVDLNLLVVLNALLDEAHVSRAAERLGLSQPAASSALDRCRHLFNDPLLERGKSAMRLTPKAETLRIPLKNLLSEIEQVLAPPEIDLMTLRQAVRLSMSDHPAAVIIGPVQTALAQTAPGIDLIVQPWHGAAAALEALAKGTSDLAVSVFPSLDVSFRRIELLEEHYKVIMRRDHPAVDSFDLDQWLSYPHVLVSGRGETRGALDESLEKYQRTRRIGIVVPSFLMVPPLLEQSELIAMIPSQCIPANASAKFALFEPPIPVDGFTLHLAWHMRRDKDPGVQHVAELVRTTLTGLGTA